MVTLRDRLARAPFHLALSAGYFGFYAHAGFLAALETAKLRPRSWSGASAGALVAALGAAGISADRLAEELLDLRRRDFWDPGFGLGLLRGRKLERRIAELAPVKRLEDCREPVAISILDLRSRRLVVRRSGDLARIVHASLAVFPLFMPVRLDEGRAADGGGLDRPALAGVAPEERVLLHDLVGRSGRLSRVDRPELEVHRLVTPGLPRLGPFRMTRGPEALETARGATLAALDRG